ncbi:phosphoribosylamine--glycine ligase [Candidatus Woesearchaeota archaeon]|nr:phosphoribosylamine--glycine ligase [Candidatus Woesearchaeota archaeon]
MENTKILLVGSGAREHALADALIAGGAELYAYMQLLNPGIKKIAKKFAVGKADDTVAAVKFAKDNSVEIAMIGPEAPLAAGMADELEKAGIKCVGPAKKLAQLETSKGFTRQLTKKYGIEGCPDFRVFNSSNKGSSTPQFGERPNAQSGTSRFAPLSTLGEIEAYLKKLGEYVVKPDGLTGGKGVKVYGEHIHSVAEALDYCNEILQSHSAAVVEEKLEGEEFSLQTLTDGNGGFLHFPVVQDHKRAFYGDVGSNTGGMGSYSDSNFLLPFLTSEDVDAAKKITEKVAAAIKKELGTAYRGVMYGGFMKTASGIKLLEYNARFGDPEAMNVLPLLKTSFVDVCKATAEGKLSGLKVEFENKATVCKYVVPEGYPDNPKTGKIIVPSVEKDCIKALTYYAAVEEKEGGIYTTKSRAVAFVGVADTIQKAEAIAEEAAAKVQGQVFHRKDIGTHQLVQKRVEHVKQLGKLKPLYSPRNEPMRIAAFMSGTGSIVRKILEFQKRQPSLFKVEMIFTDTADENVCNARKIAEEHKVAYYRSDIKEYYKKRGCSDRKDMKIRQEYDAETAKLLKMHKVDAVALCGYMSIVTSPVIGNWLTVNVHPADLRTKDSRGQRLYAGCMGPECVKKAITNGDKEIRATTHIVNEKVDAGKLLLVSKAVKLDIGRSYSGEELEKIAHEYQQKLKEEGDWKVYPETIRMLAEGRFAADGKGTVYLDGKKIPEGQETT